MASPRWNMKVGEVFNTRPRIGVRDTVWLTRRSIERTLAGALDNEGVHVCIDGPTGTGKSSLALTMLERHRMPYVGLQVTKSMTWAEFCAQVAHPVSNRKSSLKFTFKGGIDRGLPTATVQAEMGSEGKPSDDHEHLLKLTSHWNEHSICELLASNNCTLLIDDFERASPEIVSRVSDMGKLLTQSYRSPAGKIVIVGTEDICKRLFEANPSLDGRLQHVSVGTLPDKGDSWRFLSLGFDKLRKLYPGKSEFAGQNARVAECQEEVYKAADGLPKSVNELGRLIGLRCEERHVNATDILDSCKEQFDQALRVCKRQFPGMLRCVREHPVARAVLKHLYEEGIGNVHSFSEMAVALSEEFGEDQIEDAVSALIGARFLVRTGHLSDVLFTTEPKFAHILGVVVSNQEQFSDEAIVRSFVQQLSLPSI